MGVVVLYSFVFWSCHTYFLSKSKLTQQFCCNNLEVFLLRFGGLHSPLQIQTRKDVVTHTLVVKMP